MDYFNNHSTTRMSLILLLLCLLIGLISITINNFSDQLAVPDVFLSYTLWKLVWKYATGFIYGSNYHKYNCVEKLTILLNCLICALALSCTCFVVFILYECSTKIYSRKSNDDNETAQFKDWSKCPKTEKFTPNKSSTTLIVNTVWDSGVMCSQCQRLASFSNSPQWMTVRPVVLANNGFYLDQDSSIRCFRCQATVPRDNMNNHNDYHDEGCQAKHLNCNNYSESFIDNQDSMMHRQSPQNNAQPRNHAQPQNNAQPQNHAQPQNNTQPRNHAQPQNNAQPQNHAQPQNNAQQQYQTETEAGTSGQQSPSSSAATLRSAGDNSSRGRFSSSVLSPRDIRRRIREGRRQRQPVRRRHCSIV